MVTMQSNLRQRRFLWAYDLPIKTTYIDSTTAAVEQAAAHASSPLGEDGTKKLLLLFLGQPGEFADALIDCLKGEASSAAAFCAGGSVRRWLELVLRSLPILC
jgi:hypothetical protein